MKHFGTSLKRPTNHDDLQLYPFRPWLEKYWQPSLVTEELDSGWLAVMVQQSPPLCIRNPLMYTFGAVETVGLLYADHHRAKKFGIGCRFH